MCVYVCKYIYVYGMCMYVYGMCVTVAVCVFLCVYDMCMHVSIWYVCECVCIVFIYGSYEKKENKGIFHLAKYSLLPSECPLFGAQHH